jgi:hypothetical protein
LTASYDIVTSVLFVNVRKNDFVKFIRQARALNVVRLTLRLPAVFTKMNDSIYVTIKRWNKVSGHNLFGATPVLVVKMS